MTAAFDQVVRDHGARYPLMAPQDYVKLAYQRQLGPGHMAGPLPQILAALTGELAQVRSPRAEGPVEPIGGGLCRYHLTPGCGGQLPLLARLFQATARRTWGGQAGLLADLDLLSRLDLPGMADYLAAYRRAGYPSVHHSQVFRDHYQPHYRVLAMDCVRCLPLLAALEPLAAAGKRAIVAIDGPCASGKTSLAALIASVFDGTVFHMDDFFLPFEMRTPERLATPGGNVDHERMRAQVLEPLLRGAPVVLQPFDCHTGLFRPPVTVEPRPLVVVEGSYAHHPALRDCYDRTIFLTCSPERQRQRLMDREGPGGLPAFLDRWIPLEERYFAALRPQDQSDLQLDSTTLWDP